MDLVDETSEQKDENYYYHGAGGAATARFGAVKAVGQKRRKQPAGDCAENRSPFPMRQDDPVPKNGPREKCRCGPGERENAPLVLTRLNQLRIVMRLRERVDGQRTGGFVGRNGWLLLQNVAEFVDAFQHAVFRKGIHWEGDRGAVR